MLPGHIFPGQVGLHQLHSHQLCERNWGVFYNSAILYVPGQMSTRTDVYPDKCLPGHMSTRTNVYPDKNARTCVTRTYFPRTSGVAPHPITLKNSLPTNINMTLFTCSLLLDVFIKRSNKIQRNFENCPKIGWDPPPPSLCPSLRGCFGHRKSRQLVQVRKFWRQRFESRCIRDLSN